MGSGASSDAGVGTAGISSQEQQLLERVESLRDRQLRLTCDLIAIPTVNPYSGDDSAGSEAAGQDWIDDQFRSLGGRTSRLAVPSDVYQRGGLIGPANRRWEGRENVIARWQLGAGRGPTVIINDHMDTVGTAGMEFDPFDPQVKEGRLLGRGSTDTKGNMVMGLIALEALLQQAGELDGQVIFESVVDEECDGAGAGTLACCLAGVTGDVALVLDGSAGHIVNGCNGIATARLLVRGKSGHNAQGASVNAIDKAVKVKEAIDRFAAAHLQRYPTCRTNIGIFRAGTLPAIVPGLAELQVNMAYPPALAEEAQQTTGRWGGAAFRQQFEQAMARLGEVDPWFAEKPVEVSWIKDPYPYQWDASDRAVQLAAQAATQVTRTAAKVGPMAAWFDGSHLARQLNIPTFSLGQGALGAAHSANEFVVLDDLWRGAKMVALTLYRLLRR